MTPRSVLVAKTRRGVGLAALFAMLGGAATLAQGGGADWPVVTGDKGSRRYSTLDQIDASNVSRLQELWRWSSPDNALFATEASLKSPRMLPRGFQVTALEIADRLYVTTGLSQLAAIEAATGRTIWVHDPGSWKQGRPTNLGYVHRGAAWWPGDGELPPRLVYASGDAFLRAVDPLGGEPIGGFGDGGAVDLTVGLRREVARRSYAVSSPVTICRDVLVVGASISDGATQPEMPPGDVRGFDARTGALRWTFHSVAQPGEVGHETWEGGSWEYTGNTNVWTLMSADDDLGLVYLPFGTATNDWYGGHRLGDNLFSETLVAVDCETGERRWHFQAVHHGLWDYDFSTSPILADFVVDGKPVRALVQLSKQGFAYVLDRATGAPIWPIEEREVPQSGVPGERTAATQPFPTRPPPFERQGVSLDDLVDFTPELFEEAKRLLGRWQYGPLFTPPSLKGTLNVPGWAGGASWPGGAYDPELQMLFVPSMTVPIGVTLREPDASRSGFRYVAGIDTQIAGPRGLPLLKPPYGRLTAYDLSRGEIAWVTPLGDGPRHHPLLRHLNLPPLGVPARSHALATKSLLFVTTGPSLYSPQEGGEDSGGSGVAGGSTGQDAPSEAETAWWRESPKLRALDKRTGAVLWEHELPANPDGTPMTFLLEDGRQVLVLALGGRGKPYELIAFALDG